MTVRVGRRCREEGDEIVTKAAAVVAAQLLFGDVAVGDALPALNYKVSATTVVLGALATRDWRPMHHDKDFAVHRNGTQDIFLNTPNQAAWFERYLTDWTGPHGRLARVTFRMKGSVFPGDTMTLAGVVTSASVDSVGCGFIEMDVTLSVGDEVMTTCAARIALPRSAEDNPWARRGDQWRPSAAGAGAGTGTAG
jgi:acyl dehydratase